MKRAMFTIFALSVAGGAFSLSMYLTRDTDSDAMGHFDKSTPAVEVAIAMRQPIREVMNYAGSVEAMESVTIVPKVTGIVQSILVGLGDRVRKGDLLVTLDAGEFEQRVKQAAANLQLAQAQLDRYGVTYALTRREFQRIQQGLAEGIATSQEVDSATAARDSASADMDLGKAEVARMSAALDEAHINLDNTRIASPLDGVVQMRGVDPGALASSTSSLLTIVNVNPAKVIVHVPEKDIMLAKIGRQARISVGRGTHEFVGRVERVSPTLSMSTRTTLVVILVANDDGDLRPGMSADVAVVSRQDEDALVVPESAVVVDGNILSIYVVVDGKARLTPVEIGIQQNGMAQIVSGIEDGDLVIIKGQFLVKDGDNVRYQEPAGSRVG